jgi:hypothetical protein
LSQRELLVVHLTWVLTQRLDGGFGPTSRHIWRHSDTT